MSGTTKDANNDLMRRTVAMFGWDRAFVNTNVNEKVFILNKTILNIMSNFIPHETLTIDDKDPLSLQKIKKKITQEKNNVDKSYRNSKNNNNTYYLRRLKVLQEDLHNAIEVFKLNYYSRIAYKLTHIPKKTKVYWTLLNRFFNNKKIEHSIHICPSFCYQFYHSDHLWLYHCCWPDHS